MSGYRLSHEAETDLDAIAEYISNSNPVAADRLLVKLTSKFEALAAMPGLGRPREEFRAGLRSARVGAYLIFYLEDDGGITIARVVHGHRDLPSIFDPDDPPQP